jgi:CBS domain-containing protein
MPASPRPGKVKVAKTPLADVAGMANNPLLITIFIRFCAYGEQDMSVGQYCNRQVITTERTTEIREIAQLMRHHHVGTIVVVERRDGAEYPVGIVTDRDLVVEVLAQNLSPEALIVGDVMSSKLLIAREEDNFWRTLDRMSAKGVRRLPVVDEKGALLGILTIDDVLTALAVGLSDVSRLVQREIAKEVQQRQ